MAISINPLVSPRIITVLAPDTAITMQELVNQVRDWEDEQTDMEYDHLIDASGKQPLGGGVLVGITVTLRNAQLAFEARPGPAYVQCNATGGNLVAFDDLGNLIPAIYTTAFTQVILTSSSSATLMELSAIQFSSFENHVTIDPVGGSDGTAYPIGTQQSPVKNLTDAVTIAVSRGFRILYFLTDFTFPAGTYLDGYTLRGRGLTETTFTFDAGSAFLNCSAEDTKLTGVVMGVATMWNVQIVNLTGYSPIPTSNPVFIRDSLLGGTFVLPALYSGTAQIINCWSEANGCVLDCNGSDAVLAVRGFSGEVSIENNTNAAVFSVDMDSGSVTLDSSCTSGTYNIRGVGILVDNSTGTAVVNSTGLVSAEILQQNSFDQCVTVSTGGGGGTAYPMGNTSNPVNNIADAVAIASARGFRTLHFISDFTFVTGIYIDGFKLIGQGLTRTTFTFQAGSATPYCSIEDAKITGDILGLITMTRVHVFDIGSTSPYPSSQGLLIQDSLISGSLVLPTLYSGIAQLINCWTEGAPSIVDLGGATATLIVRGFTGEVTLTNNTAGTSITVDMLSGKIILGPSCSTGTYIVRGVGLLDNQSTGTAVVDSTGLVSAELIQTTSFNGYVTIDVINGEPGTEFPIGSETHPSNNLAQSLIIAANRGFRAFRVRGSLTIGATADVSGATFIGDGMISSSIIMTLGCVTEETTFKEASVEGTQNGETNYVNCLVRDVDNLHGIIQDCRLLGTLSCGTVGTDIIVMKDCYSGDESALPTIINMNDSPASLSINAFNGVLQFQNFNKNPGAGVIMIGIQTGKIIVDATCTKGDMFIRGVCELVNNATGTTVNTAGAIDTVAVGRTNKNATLIPAAL